MQIGFSLFPAIIAILAACGANPAHVTLSAPSPSASESERQKAYERLAAEAELVPVVGEDSPVGQAALRSKTNREKADWWGKLT